MKFSLSREALLKPLQLVVGVVERRQTLPILSNVLLSLEGSRLSVTGTDLEVEIIGYTEVTSAEEAGEVTVSARKLLDICRSLPDGAKVDFSSSDGKASVKSGRSRFTLATLPANEFPSVDNGENNIEFDVETETLKHLIESTSFAMAQQDVRYYLNGMLWEVSANKLRAVATDGHRMALCDATCEIEVAELTKAILPRKGVMELSRLVSDDGAVRVAMGSNHIRVNGADYCFTSKLVDGAYPDYDRVLPKGGDKQVVTAEQMANSYIALITDAIQNNWNRPPSARNGMEAELALQLMPTGEVLNVSVIKSSGNSAFDRSAENAVRRAGQFPELKNLPNKLFEQYFRKLRLKFRPEDLRL